MAYKVPYSCLEFNPVTGLCEDYMNAIIELKLPIIRYKRGDIKDNEFLKEINGIPNYEEFMTDRRIDNELRETLERAVPKYLSKLNEATEKYKSMGLQLCFEPTALLRAEKDIRKIIEGRV